MVESMACSKTFCRRVARGPGESATGGAAAGEGEREGALPFGSPLTADGIGMAWYWRWGDSIGSVEQWAGVGACLRTAALCLDLAWRSTDCRPA